MRSLTTALILLKIRLLIVLWHTVSFSSFVRSAKVAEYEAFKLKIMFKNMIFSLYHYVISNIEMKNYNLSAITTH